MYIQISEMNQLIDSLTKFINKQNKIQIELNMFIIFEYSKKEEISRKTSL